MKKSKLNAKRLKAPELYDRISDKCNFVDPSLAEQMYYGLLRVITGALREGKYVVLPGLGRLTLKKKKNMKVLDMKTGIMRPMGDVNTVTFNVDQDLSKYFNTIFKD